VHVSATSAPVPNSMGLAPAPSIGVAGSMPIAPRAANDDAEPMDRDAAEQIARAQENNVAVHRDLAAQIAKAREQLHRNVDSVLDLMETEHNGVSKDSIAEVRTRSKAKVDTPPVSLAEEVGVPVRMATNMSIGGTHENTKLALRSNTWCESSSKYNEFVQDNLDRLDNVLNKVQNEGGFLSERLEACLMMFGLTGFDREPRREGVLHNIMDSNWFSCIVTFVILCDTGFTAHAADYAMDHPKDDATPVMLAADIVFVSFYLLELLLKMAVHRKYFFRGGDWSWNMFDFFLTGQGIMDIILTHWDTSANKGHLRFIRLVRLVKLGKSLRLFRAVQFSRDLKQMVQSIVFCVGSMFWAFVLLALLLYVGSLFFVQMMHIYLSGSDGIDSAERALVYKYFGSIASGVLTLYQSASGGLDWENVYVVVSEAGTLAAGGFIFFIWFFNFAVVNVLSGIFIEKALQAAVPDREQLALEARRVEERDVKHLTDLISAMDHGKHGTITLQEFLVQAHETYASAYLKTLGINVDDAAMFFNVLQRVVGSGELPIEEFVGKLVKMKGTAKSLDLQSLAFEVSVMRSTLNKLVASLCH